MENGIYVALRPILNDLPGILANGFQLYSGFSSLPHFFIASRLVAFLSILSIYFINCRINLLYEATAQRQQLVVTDMAHKVEETRFNRKLFRAIYKMQKLI